VNLKVLRERLSTCSLQLGCLTVESMKKPASKLILVAFLILAIGSIAYCLASNQATAASPVNNVNVVFRTAWVYDSPVDNFTNSQVIGHKWWQTNLWNSPDETKAPITALSLSLDSTQSFEDINTQNLIRKGPPTLEWSFGYIPEGTEAGAWVDSGRSSGLDSVGSVSIPVTFTPGFDASRSADKTKFSAPGIQTLAITITPQKTIQEFNIYVHVMENENADLVIISPVGDNATRLSSDRHSLNVKLTGLGLNVGHTTIVTIQVTPKASEVTFMPLVNIMESDKNLASGSDIGRSFSHPVGEPGDNVGTWTWYAQNDCLWQWREVRNRWVTFEGMVEGPLGRGAGTYIGPAPVLGWRFDSGLAIGLVAIFPAIYFAGRGFRRKGKILNITRVVYPLVILIFGWYTLASIYRIISVPGVNPGDASLLPWIVLLFATPTVAFS
jgi:hypothetical protein